MGNIQSVLTTRLNKIFAIFSSDKNTSMAILGLDAAGKSTLVNLFRNEDVQTVPTLGFNIETIKICNTSIKIWDVGGQKEFINYWCEYVHDIQALVFVVDIADEERFSRAFEGFKTLVPYLANGMPVLLLLNKADLLSGDNALVEKRMADLKSIFCIDEQDYDMGTYMKHDMKVFRTSVMAVSVKNDFENMKSKGHNWSIQDSPVYAGFKWLIDEMKTKGSEVATGSGRNKFSRA